MSYLNHQRAMLDLAYQLDRDEALLDSQKQFLAAVFYRIGTGEDANEVLKVRPRRGEKLTDLIARRRMSMILHWVACAVRPDPDSEAKDMSIEDACSLAATTIVPLAKTIFPGADDRDYGAEYIIRCWGDPAYAHMRSTTRSWFDPDSPYYPLPPVKDTK